jgi:AcrR family transcriptional regulator
MRDNPGVETVDRPTSQFAPTHPHRRLSRPEAQALTRRRLLDAAAEVFGERGFRSASLTDVADRAGYTIGAVYSNFATKDALFHALMRERLELTEAGLDAAFDDGEAGGATRAESVESRIEAELDRLKAAEDAVPARWWRLLYEYRTYAAADQGAWAELAATDRRCREIIARHIEEFAVSIGLELPASPIQLAELSMALADGLRAAYAEGRSSLTSGEGLRLVVKGLLATATRIDRA